MKVVLTIGGSDSGGGAGIQADLMSIASMSCHPLTALTAITVQDSVGVEAVLPLDARWVEAQARAVLEDMPVDAFKIGLSGSTEIIEEAGQADATLLPMANAVALQQDPRMSAQGLASTVVQDPELAGDAALGVNPRDRALLDKLNDAIDEIKRDGRFDRINTRFIPFRLQ